MGRILALMLAALPAVASATSLPAEGRWEGVIEVPARPLRVVIDLQHDPTGGWKGSIVIPDLGIKGATLSQIAVKDSEIAFDIDRQLSTPAYGRATFRARLASDSEIAGEWRQAGNTALFSLRRTGNAQVEAPPRSTPVARELVGEWRGEFVLDGYPRHVSVVFDNQGTGAVATFIVIGKQTTRLPVDLVVQEGEGVRMESQTGGVAFEGRFIRDRDEIHGGVELGALDLPLVLRRAGRSAS
jgi:hypothetical protein